MDFASILEAVQPFLAAGGVGGLVAFLFKRSKSRQEKYAYLAGLLEVFGDRYGAKILNALASGQRVKAVAAVAEYVKVMSGQETRRAYLKEKTLAHISYLKALPGGEDFAVEVLETLSPGVIEEEMQSAALESPTPKKQFRSAAEAEAAVD